MDDFVISNLQESKNEWCSRLVSIFTPLVIEGLRSIFNEAWKICLDNNEITKYLMTFQNLLCRVPKWNSVIVEEERVRIIERSGCGYLEDLITCVHIIQLKILTCIRVGNKQKKIDISIPKLDHFIHKVYIHAARKVYTNVYLFEKGANVSPLQVQRCNRELELLVQESIMMAIRDSIPTEAIIKAYMDESVEHEEEVFIENLEDPLLKEEEGEKEEKGEGSKEKEEVKESLSAAAERAMEKEPPKIVPSIQNISEDAVVTKLSFNDVDSVLEMDTNEKKEVVAPKTLDRLEEISVSRALQRKLEEEEDDDEEEDKIRIHSEEVPLDFFDLNGENQRTEKRELSLEDSLALLDVEELS
jgi:Family of unknown function (DUF5764)